MSQIPFAQVCRDVLGNLQGDHQLRLLYYDFAADAHFGKSKTCKWNVWLASGELVTSAGDIARRYGWTIQEAKTRLAKMKKLGIVRMETVRCYNPDRPSVHCATKITVFIN